MSTILLISIVALVVSLFTLSYLCLRYRDMKIDECYRVLEVMEYGQLTYYPQVLKCNTFGTKWFFFYWDYLASDIVQMKLGFHTKALAQEFIDQDKKNYTKVIPV